MSISRRQFFRGFVGPTAEQQRERRVQIVENYIRTNLLPYDFALTGEQTLDILTAAITGLDLGTVGDVLTYDQRLQIRDIVDGRVQQYRDEYLKAEAVRREGRSFVAEFFSRETTPEDLERLRQRFHVPYPAILEEEIERQVDTWLAGLSNAYLAECDSTAIRELVFSELRSWC